MTWKNKTDDWFDATYEQKLFRRKTSQMLESGYTNKEITQLTGLTIKAIEHIRIEYNTPTYPQLTWINKYKYNTIVGEDPKQNQNKS